MNNKKQKFLTVAPFECAWDEEIKFREAGRGCILFEAFAPNDVTVVFREQVGSQRYHYKMDNDPNYTIILGSHRNRRLRIEVDGRSVVDVAGIGLCCSSSFQSYWISIYDGLISIGKGKHPFQDVLYQWLDSEPNYNVRYVGLSSWDKHVGYRNINVLSLTSNLNSLWSHINYKEYEGNNDGVEGTRGTIDSYEKCVLYSFLENWDLSDVTFFVGAERRAIPGHMVILNAFGDFLPKCTDGNIIELPFSSYSVLHALLVYIYTGRTQIEKPQLEPLLELSRQFQISSLTRQCERIMDQFEINKKLLDSEKSVVIVNPSNQFQQLGVSPCEVPIDVHKLKQFLATGEHSDANIHIEGHGLVAHSHKLILSLWSPPFAKMFTNGMLESCSSDIVLKDVSAEAFSIMLQFMYSGEVDLNEEGIGSVIIPLLLLADQFGVLLLLRECCKYLMDYLSKDSACPILLAVLAIPSCKALQETCKRTFSMHFDYCTTVNTDFLFLDEATFKDIIQHPEMTVTTEEKILDAILMWCMQGLEICSWIIVDGLLSSLEAEALFGERFPSVNILLPLVRFPLMQLSLLQKLEKSNLYNKLPVFEHLIKEAMEYLGAGLPILGVERNLRFQHRITSFKELQYICDGDSNGVIYFAGTSYGQHLWVNPVSSKKITVLASSPVSRYTDPKAVVSRMYQATSFAGPRTENGCSCSWWMIDIGHDHQLMCNYYTLRQDGSSSFVRSWALQGSMDGTNWTNLKTHENDNTVCRPGQFASWLVDGAMSMLPFRFFRVILTGPTAADTNSWNFCICYIELYGYFR